MTGKNFYNQSKISIPGPGQYNNDKVGYVKNKEPSWRIGTSSREDGLKRTQRENFPGPGNYNLPSRALEGKLYKFGNEKRIDNQRGFIPGPGQYHIPCSIVDVPKYQTNSSGFQEQFRFI